MEHVQQLDRPFPWRAAALVAGALALAELVALLALAGVRLAPDQRGADAASPARALPGATHRAPARTPARTPAAHARPLQPRSRVSVLILNGNGVTHAAGDAAARLLARGYRRALPEDAPSHDYARSLVLFAPGWQREGRRLGRDLGIRAVAPLDGMKPSQLRDSQLVVILGGS